MAGSPGLATIEDSQTLYDTISAGRPDQQTSAGTSGLTQPFLGTPPTLNPPYDMSKPAEHERLWQDRLDRSEAIEKMRLAPPRVRLWDGDFNLRGEVAGWRDIDFEFIENDTGTATLQLSLAHYLSLWVMNFSGREKRNVIITIDKQGARWSGFMDNYKVVTTTNNDAYLEITFKHDYEQTKHIFCWCNPFLRPEVQFPKLWIVFGPSKWCLLLTLFVNIFRLESSLWSFPDNPLDINEWMDLNTSTWRNVVKPFPLVEDNSNLTICFTRFKTWHDLAKPILEDAQLTVTCRRYLSAEDPHPFLDLQGELDTPLIESFEASFPLRNGCLVWDIQDNSGWGTETAFGGSIETGLIRAVVTIADDGYTEGVDVFSGDPTYPGEYYTPAFLGTSPDAPWVIYDVASPYTG